MTFGECAAVEHLEAFTCVILAAPDGTVPVEVTARCAEGVFSPQGGRRALKCLPGGAEVLFAPGVHCTPWESVFS